MCKIISQIKLLAEHEGITIGNLERIIGASKGVLSRAISNGTDIQSKWILAIVENYPHYSTEWLLTGKGKMLKSTIPAIDPELVKSNPINNENYTPPTFPTEIIEPTESLVHSNLSHKMRGAIPLVTEQAVGGFSSPHFSIKEKDVLAYYVIPKFRNLNVDFMIEVIGDSMIPKFYPGDIIACSIITNPRYIEWNKCHLIATSDRGMIVKRLMPGTDTACLTVVSDNKNYPPFEIPKDEITGMARVIGCIHLE